MLDYSRYRSTPNRQAGIARKCRCQLERPWDTFLGRVSEWEKVKPRATKLYFGQVLHFYPLSSECTRMRWIYEPWYDFSILCVPLCRHIVTSPQYTRYKLMKMIFMAIGVGCFCLGIKSAGTPGETQIYIALVLGPRIKQPITFSRMKHSRLFNEQRGILLWHLIWGAVESVKKITEKKPKRVVNLIGEQQQNCLKRAISLKSLISRQ